MILIANYIETESKKMAVIPKKISKMNCMGKEN
jgi:hypothetical protein